MMAIEKTKYIRATKLSLTHILVLLGDELFLHYINFVYPNYDMYEYITIDGLARVHRYFLDRNQKEESKPEKFDAMITPLWTLEEMRDHVNEV